MSASATVMTSGHRRRAAGLYVMVLSVSMILMTTGLAALLVVRIQQRGADGGNDLSAASLYAQSAIELGMQWIENNSTWRTSRGEGFWSVDQAIGTGKFSLEANDLGSNGLLESSADTDSVLLTGTGFKGDARYKLQVTLTPQLRGLDCLEVALAAGGDLAFSSTLTCDQTVSANGSIIAAGASGTSDLEAVGTIDPGGIVGAQTTLSDPRIMPDAATVFDYYIANGTALDISQLPTVDGKPKISDVVISPASNPYPPNDTNSEGIYVLNCAGIDITISTSRIVGTLVLLDPGPNSQIHSSTNWEPAVVNYPALLVRGNMAFRFQAGVLQESSLAGNFNPPGTPYEGVEDTDTTDTYPSVIKGLVYVSVNITISNAPVFDGAVVAGNNLDADGDLNLTYRATYFNDPPPGFAAPPQMIISPSSWQQVVN